MNLTLSAEQTEERVYRLRAEADARRAWKAASDAEHRLQRAREELVEMEAAADQHNARVNSLVSTLTCVAVAGWALVALMMVGVI